MEKPKIKIHVEEQLKKSGRSLYWLSRTTGISYSTLWRLTKDRALGLNFATLEKLCAALECQPGDLITFTEEQKEGNLSVTQKHIAANFGGQ